MRRVTAAILVELQLEGPQTMLPRPKTRFLEIMTGFSFNRRLGRLSIWIPTTTLMCSGSRLGDFPPRPLSIKTSRTIARGTLYPQTHIRWRQIRRVPLHILAEILPSLHGAQSHVSLPTAKTGLGQASIVQALRMALI